MNKVALISTSAVLLAAARTLSCSPAKLKILSLIILLIAIVGLNLYVTGQLTSEREHEPLLSIPIRDANATLPPHPKKETCPYEKLDPSFRTVTIESSPTSAYKMFLHGASKDKYISESIFRSKGQRPFEQHLQVLMEKQLRGRVPIETTILDIGANIGLHTLHLASKGYLVHAFEPVRDNFNLLKCSKVESRFDNLVLNNFGLSNEEAELCMKLNPDNQGGHQVNKTGVCPEDEKVTIKKLDDYFDRVLFGISPYMIKIDVEGHEMFAFIGGEKMFKKDPPKLIFSEVVPWLFPTHGQDVMQYYDFFRNYGYTIYLVKSSRLELLAHGGVTPSNLHDIVMVHSSIDLVK